MIQTPPDIHNHHRDSINLNRTQSPDSQSSLSYLVSIINTKIGPSDPHDLPRFQIHTIQSQTQPAKHTQRESKNSRSTRNPRI